MEVKICHLYPDVLNLYGDGGNIRCLTQRLKWRGISAEVEKMPIGSPKNLTGFDIVFIGGGQDFEQEVLLDDLHRGRDRELVAAIEDGVCVLAICGGYQMLGHYYETHDGKKCDFIGALDLFTIGDKKRMIGNYMYQVNEKLGDFTVVGFENHSGKTRLGAGVEPLGKVLAGFGNNGEDRTEGAHYKNTFGTYSHGPLLPKNPDFADLLLRTALMRKYGNEALSPLDDRAERLAHSEMCERLKKSTAYERN